MIMPYFVLEEAVVVDHIAARFTTTCTINAYRYKSFEFESRSWPGALDTTLCDKVIPTRHFSHSLILLV